MVGQKYSDIESTQFIFAGLSALLFGFSKAGFKGIGVVCVTLMALAFEAKQSTGIVMPLLVLADIFAIYYYRKYVIVKHLYRLLPLMVIGVLLGVWVGDDISEQLFRKGMAVIIIFSGIMMLLFDRLHRKYIPQGMWFAGIMGLGAGFTTMIGNLAGSFSNLYFLAMRFPKNEFIGTAAWLFFIINLFKLPFHICVWETITRASLWIDLMLAPLVILGFFIGLRLIKLVSNTQFKYYIIAITILGGFIIFIR